MKALKLWAQALGYDGVFAGLLILWQCYEIPGAGRVFLFFVWALTIVRTLAAINAFKDPSAAPRRPPFYAYYVWVRDLFICGVLAWTGLTVTASFFLVGRLLIEASCTGKPPVQTPTE